MDYHEYEDFFLLIFDTFAFDAGASCSFGFDSRLGPRADVCGLAGFSAIVFKIYVLV
jgi:hypothetical protein